MSYYRQQLEDWLKTVIVKADKVFDVGGDQGHVEERVGVWDVKEYRILDLPDYDLQEADNGDLSSLGKADIVFCLEVFDYIKDPVMAFENLYKLAKIRGKIYVTFPFVYPHHNEIELDGLRYTQQSIEWLAGRSKLKIKNLWYRIDKSDLLQQFYAADGMHPAKGYNHHNVTGFIVEFEK